MKSGRFNAYPLDSLEGLQPNGVLPTIESHQGFRCLNLVPSPDVVESDGPTFAILEDSKFHNGVIEISLSGTEPKDAASKKFAGDFVGIGFRIQSDASELDPDLDPKINPANVAKFECIYFRPGHALDNDQLTRNHSVQYFSYPKHLFDSLREEYLQQDQLNQEQKQKNRSLPKSDQIPVIKPKIYEAYAPISSQKWFRIRLEVEGTVAKLYVNGTAEPALIVNDLKLGDSEGAIGLFVERECVAYFSDLKITYYDD